MQQQKRTRIGRSPLEILASALCVLYGLAFFYLAHVLEDMGLIQIYVRQAQTVGMALFLAALLGILRLQTLTVALHVLIAIAWLGLIPIGYRLDQDMGNAGLWFTLGAIGISACLSSLHLFFARQLKRQAQ
nr:hypothetical protein [Armatimonas sp.]